MAKLSTLAAPDSDRVIQEECLTHADNFSLDNYLGDGALSNFNAHSSEQITDYTSVQRGGADMPGWCAFAIGGIVTFLFVYIGIARPAAQELSRMRSQIRLMEESLATVVGHQDAVGKATGLLAELAEQSDRYAAADEALNQIAHVQGRLGAISQQSRYVNEVLSQFMAVHEDMIRVAENKADVSRAIAEVEAPPHQVGRVSGRFARCAADDQ